MTDTVRSAISAEFLTQGEIMLNQKTAPNSFPTTSGRVASRRPTPFERLQTRLGLYDREKALAAFEALREQRARCRTAKKRIPEGLEAKLIIISVYHSL